MSLFISPLSAQSDLDSLVGKLNKPQKELVSGTFEGTRVVNLQTVEKAGPHNLQLMIQHRFGPFNGGAYQFFGLDQATMRIGLEYGISPLLAVGVGRSTLNKIYDFYGKLSLLRQSTGPASFPVSVSYFGSITLQTLTWSDIAVKIHFSLRMVFTHQLIIASKINNRLSVEIVPTFLHKNLVQAINDKNDFYAVGFGARWRFAKRSSFNVEYIYRIPPKDRTAPSYAAYYNSFSVGFDIATGGHVFQLHLTNSLPMIEKGFITETEERWGNGGIHLGFNLSRDFSFGKKNSKSSW
jgi:hypothetical protein